jgi:2-polyprenyl-6-methoxyphenol hydroxylase-like FAD-dependent oxidoreductase
MTHKDDGDIGESWQQPGNLEDVHKLVEGWSPDIVAAVHKMKDCLDWKICYRDPLPTWVSRSGKVALIGDSAHPHLPTSAQGASQATEDGAVLALCLTLAGKGNVPLATRTYEKLRYDRVRQAQKTGEDLRDRWHNALKQLNNNEEPDQEMLLMKVLFCTSQLT